MASLGSQSTHPNRSLRQHPSSRPNRRLSSHPSIRPKHKEAPVPRTGTTPARIFLRYDRRCRLLSAAVDARFCSIPVHQRGKARTHSRHNETIVVRLHTCETAIFMVGVISPEIFGIRYYPFYSQIICIFDADLVPCQLPYTVAQLSYVVLCTSH
jgi:hypothetical protein